ncbi:endonuclease/exonuclease/phosphatase family protein [Primorskyibacter aestuariivivens]|uniref:endonuclease/exonuclease/phosphatase family protein n=1 Tax=Primorskyibacter aestuariivivens TaxID=1888912 RepID=UPI002300CC3D|nr:endonuclease/exonuclease/phosphatase family protein [Primorskyibacter aestuariivivens]MDA7427219.1 endonuclease/exonuclease/phosphatase family protein [Primorskyibacter aestuariivivens]
MRIATYNLQNLRLRRRQGVVALDGAVDADMGAQSSAVLDVEDRMLAARVIAAANADLVALQEVFDRDTLDHFHNRFLRVADVASYPHRICLPGNDGRGLNVAALSRVAPQAVTSHAAHSGAALGLMDLPPDLRDKPLFRRDCLQLDFAALSVFICHFKAPYPDPDRARQVRQAEARGVRAVIERAFEHPAEARWIILGDFNEPASEASPAALAPLADGFAVDLMARGGGTPAWTYETPDTHLLSRPDRVLVSPALATAFPGVVPQVIRQGMAADVRRHGPSPRARLTGRPHASDHALVHVTFPGLTLT